MRIYFRIKPAWLSILIGIAVGSVATFSHAQNDSAEDGGEYLIRSPRPSETPVEWSEADLAIKEAMEFDRNYSSADHANQPAAIAAWKKVLKRDDISIEQRAFVWWRIASLYGYNLNPSIGEASDHDKSREAFDRVLTMLPDRVSFETLNSATQFASMPGTEAERAVRIARSFNRIITLSEEDIERSINRVNSRARLLDDKFFSLGRSPYTKKQQLHNLVEDYREVVSRQVSEFFEWGRDTDAMGDLLNSIEDNANPEELEKWRGILWDLRWELLKGRVSKFIPALFKSD